MLLICSYFKWISNFFNKMYEIIRMIINSLKFNKTIFLLILIHFLLSSNKSLLIPVNLLLNCSCLLQIFWTKHIKNYSKFNERIFLLILIHFLLSSTKSLLISVNLLLNCSCLLHEFQIFLMKRMKLFEW